jgi:hypothetical protein
MQYVAATRQLTIGSVRVDTEDEDPITYMANETGVGCGYIHNEKDLYETRELAIAAAEAEATRRNNDPEGKILPFYNECVSLSDYQLKQVTALPKPKRKRK